MYWYISFLRPPPVSAEAGSSITITPQVANDLRTELRYETTEIYSTWQRCEPSLQSALPSSHLVSFTPPESTYRPMNIHLPAQARIGEKWRLCLSTTESSLPSSSTEIVNGQDILILTGSSSGCVPISVYSEGIEIIRPNPAQGGVTKGLGGQSGKVKGKGKEKMEEREKSKGKGKEKDEGPKQTRIIREWETPAGMLRIIEQTSFDLDKKIWDSGLALSSWLYRHVLSDEPFSPANISENTQETKGLVKEILDLLKAPGSSSDILELGSGTGLVSIALHSIKARLALIKGRIVVTDLESAIPLMEENLSLNTLSSGDPGGLRLRADVLDWDRPLPLWVAGDEEDDWPDLIIAADVTYNTASFPSLIKTLKSLLQPPDREHRPKLVLAYKKRDEGERTLWDMLEQEDIRMVLVDCIPGVQDGEGRVEIWIGWSDVDV